MRCPRQQVTKVLRARTPRSSGPPTRCRECGLAEVGELRIADEAELDAVALEDHGLSRVRKIAAAPDMGNARGVENAQGIQEPPLFCVECMVVGQVYDAYPG